MADEVTNSLVILATRRDFQLIIDVLKRIDVVPRQVLLEVMIAEIALTKDLQFGVAWAFSEGMLGSAQGADIEPLATRLEEIARDVAALREILAPGAEAPPRAQERLTVTEA